MVGEFIGSAFSAGEGGGRVRGFPQDCFLVTVAVRLAEPDAVFDGMFKQADIAVDAVTGGDSGDIPPVHVLDKVPGFCGPQQVTPQP